jgi:hypothetical protein
MADTDDQGMKVYIEGQEYLLDDFSLGELEWLEEELGELGDDTLTSMRGLVRMVVVVKRRDDPSYTIDQARLVKFTAFAAPTPAPEPAKKTRPTRAARAATSTPAGSGAIS